MQENNFEKQVRQKMDELKLKPSEEVWQKLYVAIAKQKSGRRTIALVLLLLLFIGSAIFVLSDYTTHKKINNAVSEKNISTKTNNNKEHIDNGNDTKKVTVTNKQTADRNDLEVNKIRIVDLPSIKKKINHLTPVPISAKAKASVSVVAGAAVNHPNIIKYKTSPKLTAQISKSIAVDLVNEKGNTIDTNTTMALVLNPLANNKLIKGQVMDTDQVDKTLVKIISDDTLAIPKTEQNKLASVKNIKQLKPNNQWKIGLNFSVGIAATKNGYLGIIGSGNNDGSKSFDQAQPSTGVSTPPVAMSHVSAKMKSGTGIVLGVSLQKNISSKTTLLLGLNYKTYISSMMIGNRIDSSINYSGNYLSRNSFFYRNGNKLNYKNKFQFIELPVAIRVKLGKQNKLPIYFNTGLSISQLLGSTALQFDPQSGAYYSNNGLLNKTQVNVSAGLLFSLSGHAKNPFLIGPDVNFSLTKMANTGLYKNRHYSYLGIQVQKTFGKK